MLLQVAEANLDIYMYRLSKIPMVNTEYVSITGQTHLWSPFVAI